MDIKLFADVFSC